jgi:hypothetical protein
VTIAYPVISTMTRTLKPRRGTSITREASYDGHPAVCGCFLFDFITGVVAGILIAVRTEPCG